MTINTDSEEEALNIPPNTSSENLSEEDFPSANPDHSIPVKKDETMEVHHHPHVEKKSFKEYLLEGLMIFLAVSMGFAAESLREHIVNKERENIYMASFYQDLSNDQTDLPKLISNIMDQQIIPAKSLPRLFRKSTTNTEADSIYYFFRKLIRQQGLRGYITDRTFEQIKNAGEMRLITNKNISDSLIDYYKDIVYTEYLQQSLLGYKAKLWENLPLVLKSEDYSRSIDSLNSVYIAPAHSYLLSVDPVNVNRLLIQVEEIGALSLSIKKSIEKVLRRNGRIKKLIEEKYQVHKD
jgi:hypothetical protein